MSVEQRFAPEANASRQINNVLVLSENVAASAPGVREQHSPRNAINARDREIGIPRRSIVAGAGRPGLDARRREGELWHEDTIQESQSDQTAKKLLRYDKS